MEDQEKTLQQELQDWVKDALKKLAHFFMPNPKDNILLQIVKFIFKIPVALIVLCASPILLIVLGIAFAAVL